MPVDQRIEAIIEQLITILAFLERPVVQQQLAGLVVVMLLAWLFKEGLYRLERRFLISKVKTPSQSRWKRWLLAIQHLYFPLLAIAFLWLMVWLFRSQEQPSGLLVEAQLLFWLWSGYGVFVAWLSATFGEESVQRYDHSLLFPLFIWLVGRRLIDNLIDTHLLAQIELTVLFNTPITLGALLTAGFVFYLFVAVTWLLQEVLEQVVIPRTTADPGVTHSVLAISRLLLLLIGFFVAATTLGFNLSTFALIGGGLSVGIGFGLQQVFANFISGILLFFDQAIRPGDLVEVDGQIGTVEKLSIRSTLVRTNNNRDLIIPNENLLTSVVTTYTKKEQFIHLLLPVGVSYDSNPKIVRQVLLEAALAHEFVQADPAPTVFFIGFGESSIDFELGVWISQPRQIKQINSDLYFMIWDTLAEHHIEIPYPQRDLNLRRGWEKLAAVVR